MSQRALGPQWSQPTLPGMNIKPSDAHRWPRGYTPERMAEVREAPLDINIHGSGGAWGGPAGPRKVQEVIARSTAPMDNIKPMFNGDKLSIEVGEKNGGRNAGGTYSGNRGGLGKITVLPAAKTSNTFPEQALLHELGHMESNVQHQEGLRADDSSAYETPQQRGREEAFADDYKATHWRPDPREQRRAPDSREMTPHSAYEHEDTWTKKKGFGKRGHKAYLEARTTPIQKDVERARWERKSRGYYQAPLDGNYNGGMAAGDRNGIFGTAPQWVTANPEPKKKGRKR